MPNTRQNSTKSTSKDPTVFSTEMSESSGVKPTTSDPKKQNEDSTSNSEILQMLTKMNSKLDHLTTGQSKLESKLLMIEEKLNQQESSINNLETSLNFNSEEVSELKSTTCDLETNFVTLHEKLKFLQMEMDNMQRYSRNFNLRFVGIPEQSKDLGYEDPIKVVKDLIHTHLNLVVDIENAHRTGKTREDGKPRHIIAKFLRRPQRFQVLTQRSKFKENKINVVEDLIFSDLQSRRSLSVHAKEAWESKKKVRFSKGSLFIDGVKFIPPETVK